MSHSEVHGVKYNDETYKACRSSVRSHAIPLPPLGAAARTSTPMITLLAQSSENVVMSEKQLREISQSGSQIKRLVEK